MPRRDTGSPYCTVRNLLTRHGGGALLPREHFVGSVTLMIRECAWCRVVLEFGQSETEQVTHTVCGLCESRMQLEIPGENFVAQLQAFASMV